MSRKKKAHDPQPLTTEADAWDLGYREDKWHLVEFGQYLPLEMIHRAVRHDPTLINAFREGSCAHSHDDYHKVSINDRDPNPYRPPEEVKS